MDVQDMNKEPTFDYYVGYQDINYVISDIKFYRTTITSDMISLHYQNEIDNYIFDDEDTNQKCDSYECFLDIAR